MRLTTLLVLVGVIAAACSGKSFPPPTEPAPATTTLQPTTPTTGLGSVLDRVPEVARAGTNATDPRGSVYWVVWSTCGEGSQADVAAANGGREAGWILLDDLLDDPGIAVGDHIVPTCKAAVALLDKAGGDPATEDPAYVLAAHLFLAQVNLNVGAKTCPAAEEAVIAGHVVLSAIGFDASSIYFEDPRVGPDGPTADIVELLTAYNAGELCR